MNRCPHCPRPPESFCLGTRSPVICNRRNPNHPDRNSAFDSSLAGEDGTVEVRATSGETEVISDPFKLELYRKMHGCGFRQVIEGQCPDCRGICTKDGGELLKEREQCFECIEAGLNG